MADSRDQPELETLSYKSKCIICGGKGRIYRAMCWQDCPKCSIETEIAAEEKRQTDALSTIQGKNTPVIKPEARVNSSKVAGQPKGNHSSACASLNHPYADCTCVEQPNQNLMIITEIEGLMSQVNEKLYKLPNIVSRFKAIEEIDLFQKTTLFELRKAFE